MKTHQFEELTMHLSIIIALMAYNYGIRWLFIIFTIYSIFNVYSALTTSYKSYLKDKIKKIKK